MSKCMCKPYKPSGKQSNTRWRDVFNTHIENTHGAVQIYREFLRFKKDLNGSLKLEQDVGLDSK